ncbi:Lsr2 family protein [Rhodococcus sp. ARC_M6]|nr:Lsr2 family protein [Rhodococcus sp. ARC_M6]
MEFSPQGIDYVIDLRLANADKMGVALQPYISVTEKIGVARRSRKLPATAVEKATGSGRSTEQLQAIRDWAKQNDYEVLPRGRIKQEIIAVKLISRSR